MQNAIIYAEPYALNTQLNQSRFDNLINCIRIRFCIQYHILNYDVMYAANYIAIFRVRQKLPFCMNSNVGDYYVYITKYTHSYLNKKKVDGTD